jgi:hypothetical protein
MRRHELDPVSLVFGFAFTGLGLLFLFGRADQAFRLHWLWPLLLLVLGAAILLDTARTRTRPDPDADRDPGEAERDRGHGEHHPDAEPAVDNREHPI